MNIKFRYLVIAAFMVSCSKSENSNFPPLPHPLPPEEPKIISNGSGALTGQTALFEVSQNLGEKRGLTNAVLTLPADTTPSEARKTIKGKVSRIHEVITAENCQIEASQPTDKIDPSNGAAALFPRFKVVIAGPHCPMEVTLNMNVVGDSSDTHEICNDSPKEKVCKFIGRMEMSYRILDEKLSEELQVSNGELHMLFKVEQTFAGDSSLSIQEPPNMVMKGSTEFEFKAFEPKGQTHLVIGSQAFDVNMSLPVPGDPDETLHMISTVKEDVQYEDKTTQVSATFSASINTNGNNSQENYMIDGTAVTAETYASGREKFANSMMKFGKKNNNKELPNPFPNPGRGPGQIPPPPLISHR